MRPTIDNETESVYECVQCGARIEAADSRVCDECGGELLNLSRERDL
jgi:rRNA maturation endonuclease Nob1